MLAALPLVLAVAGVTTSLLHRPEFAGHLLRWAWHVLVIECTALAILCCVGVVYEKVSFDRARRLHPMPGQLVDIGGYRLHLDCKGQGSPTVVLVYGMSGSYLDWHFVQPQLAQSTRVCSFDRPGYGWSDVSPGRPLPSIHADEQHTLLPRAGEKPPFILVGHSLGGFDVLMYAHRYANQVLGVVLVDSSHPGSYTQFGWRDRLGLRFFQFTAPFGLPRWRKWCLQGPTEIADQKAAFNRQPHLFETNYQLRDAYPAASEEMLGVTSIGSTPLVVISRDPHRDHDLYLNAAGEQEWARHQEDLVRLSSNSRYVIAEGSSHAIPLERPDAIVDQVRQLLGIRDTGAGQVRREDRR